MVGAAGAGVVSEAVEVRDFWKSLRGEWQRVKQATAGVRAKWQTRSPEKCARTPSALEAHRAAMLHDGRLPCKAKSYRALLRAACREYDQLIQRETKHARVGRQQGRKTA